MTDPTWRHVASPVRRVGRLPFVLAWALGAGAVVVRLIGDGDVVAPWHRIASLVAVSVLLLRVVPALAPFAALVTTLGVVEVHPASALEGLTLAVVLAAGWMVALGGAPRRQIVGRSDAGVVVTSPVGVALLGATGVVTALGVPVPWVAAVAAGAVVALALSVRTPSSAPTGRTGRAATLTAPLHAVVAFQQRWIERIGEVLGSVIRAVAMVPGAVVVSVVWVVWRATGRDPLASLAPGASTSWVEVGGDDPAADRPFATTRRTVYRGSVGSRVASSVVFLAIVSGIVWMGAESTGELVARLRPDDFETRDDCKTTPAQLEPPRIDWRLLGCEQDEYVSWALFDGASTLRLADRDGVGIHSEDGVRAGWRAPECACRRYTVWWFGGSAAWGWYQRDDYSLPSLIAKEAAAAGVVLDIENRAVPGWTVGQSVRSFAELLATGERPDIAVFYDGANDISMQRARNVAGRGADEAEGALIEPRVDALLRTGPLPWSGQSDDPVAPLPPERLTPAQVAEHAMVRFGNGVRLGTTLGEVAGVPTVFSWQPVFPTAPEAAGDDDPISPQERVEWRTIVPVVRRDMPDGVVDLTDSLDAIDRPVFVDWVHTDEHGAAEVARHFAPEIIARLEEGS